MKQWSTYVATTLVVLGIVVTVWFLAGRNNVNSQENPTASTKSTKQVEPTSLSSTAIAYEKAADDIFFGNSQFDRMRIERLRKGLPIVVTRRRERILITYWRERLNPDLCDEYALRCIELADSLRAGTTKWKDVAAYLRQDSSRLVPLTQDWGATVGLYSMAFSVADSRALKNRASLTYQEVGQTYTLEQLRKACNLTHLVMPDPPYDWVEGAEKDRKAKRPWAVPPKRGEYGDPEDER